MTDQQPKIKGVVDIVFLIDATGSMSPCLEALKANIGIFVDVLTKKEQNANPVKDWRGKIVGYRDHVADGETWYVDHPFVRDASELKAQLKDLAPSGGGDEPESLMDALYKVANMGETTSDQAEDQMKWRARGSVARAVIIFTDASYKDKMTIPEASGGEFTDLANAVYSSRLRIDVFAPSMPCYDEFSGLSKCIVEPIPVGAEGPQKALQDFTGDQANFQKTLEMLAKTLSVERPPEALG